MLGQNWHHLQNSARFFSSSLAIRSRSSDWRQLNETMAGGSLRVLGAWIVVSNNGVIFGHELGMHDNSLLAAAPIELPHDSVSDAKCHVATAPAEGVQRRRQFVHALLSTL